MLEIAKLVASFLTGGLGGALLTEWFRRRRSRVHAIPLIERVNRQVSPELQGFTLARIGGTSANRELEEVKNLREYQLTVRNTSSAHLQDAEVQFEFPADDVEAWVSRPALSKTALIDVGATATTPWRKAFRWRIPHFPAGDSVEFTFRAVDPSSETYEAALYHSEGIVFARVVGEPRPKRDSSLLELGVTGLTLALVAAGLLYSWQGSRRNEGRDEKRLAELVTQSAALVKQTAALAQAFKPEKLTTIKLAGCNLRVTSSSEQMHSGLWYTQTSIFNLGSQECFIRSGKMFSGEPFTVKPGRVEGAGVGFSEGEPKSADAEISVHTAKASPTATTAPVYVAP